MSGSPGTTEGGGSEDGRGGRCRRSSRARGDRPRWPLSRCAPPRVARDTVCDGGPVRDEETWLHERLVERDKSALLEGLDRFGRIVYSTSLAESGGSLVAEAVTEHVFVELWRRPEAFHPRRGPLALQLVRATLRPATA